MNRGRAAVAVALTVMFGLSACDPNRNAEKAPDAAAAVETPAGVAPPAGPAEAPSSDIVPAIPAALPAPGAPAFAALYPGAAVEGDPLTAGGPSGPGGIVTFTTEADPDVVVAFYRERAESAGLTSVTAMNQGEARAYGAEEKSTGATVQVVAAPLEDGDTSVQLTWSKGQ